MKTEKNEATERSNQTVNSSLFSSFRHQYNTASNEAGKNRIIEASETFKESNLCSVFPKNTEPNQTE